MKNKFLSKSVPRGTRTIWRYLGALIILFTFAIGQTWGADPTYVLLKSVDFTNTTNFPAVTYSSSTADVKTTVNGVFFWAKKGSKALKVNDGVTGVDFQTQNMSNNGQHGVAIPVTGVNGSLKVIVYHSYNNTSASFKIGISHATDNDPSGTQTFDASPGNSGTKNKNDHVQIKTGLTGTEYIVWAGENGSSYTCFQRVEIYTEAPTGYSVTYVENGHGANQTDLTGQTALPNPLPTLSESGWIFGGWFTDNGTFETAAVAGASLSANATLYAKWTEDPGVTKYSVTYALNGPSGDAPTQEDVAEGASFNLAAAPSWAGHAFDGWLCSADAAVKAAGSSYTMTAANTTFTAQWHEVDCKIYSLTGGIGSAEGTAGDYEVTASTLILKNSNARIKLTPAGGETFKSGDVITISGYTGSATKKFGVYVKNAAGSSNIATAEETNLGDGYATATLSADAEYVFLARKESTTMNVLTCEVHRACAEGAAAGLSYATTEVNKTEGDAAFTNALTNANSLVVAGYSSSNTAVATVDKAGQVTIVAPGTATITANSAVQTKAGTLYAAGTATYTLNVAALPEYTVTYDLNGGSGDPTEVDHKAGEKFNLHDGVTGITAPTSKTFVNWKDQDDALFAGGVEYTMPAKDVTLTAQWAGDVYTVKFMDGETLLDTKVVEVGLHPADIEHPTKPLYTFAAWQLSGSDVVLDDVNGTKDAEIILTVRWAKVYGNNVDFEAYILANTSEKDDADKAEAYVKSQNYALSTKTGTTFDSNNSTNNGAYAGLKIKNNGTVLSWNVAAGKVVEFKAGVMVANGSLAINGGAATTIDGGTTGTGDNFKIHYFYNAAEALYTFTTSNGSAEVVKAITIRDPYTVSYNPHGADAIDAQNATPSVTLPTPVNGTGNFKGWYDAETEGNKIGNAGASYTPTANITLHAQWEVVSSDNTLSDLQVDGATVAGFDPAVQIYNLVYEYGQQPVITSATATAGALATVTINNTPVEEATFKYVQVKVEAESGAERFYQVRYTNNPKQGATIFKAELTSNTAADYSGMYADGDNSEIKLADDGANGYKFSGTSNYVKMAIADATFAEGDMLKMTYTTNPQQGELAIYDGTTKLQGTAYSNHILTFSDAADGKSTLYIRRTSDNNFNGWVAEVEVQRYMAPIIKSYKIGEVAGTINQDLKTIAIELPYGTTLSGVAATIEAYANGGATVTAPTPLAYDTPLGYKVSSAYAEDGDVDYTVTITEAEHYEAMIVGGANYETLAAAVAAAQADDVVKLLDNVDLMATGLTIAENITLDLNGFNIKAGEQIDNDILVPAGKKLTLVDNSENHLGKIYTEQAYTGAVTGYGLIRVAGELLMQSGNIYAVIESDPANLGQFAVVLGAGGKATIEGGQIKAGWYAISNNGNNTGSTIIVSGGELISTADFAIYNPAKESTVTVSGGVVYGAAGGIAMNRGELTVTGGTITSKDQGTTGTWGDGTGGMSNAAIAASGKYESVEVEISGGTIIAEGTAVMITNGTTNPVEVAISGGQFSHVVPAEYCAEGFAPVTTPNAQGKYEVIALGVIRGQAVQDPTTEVYSYTLDNGVVIYASNSEGKLSTSTMTATSSDVVACGGDEGGHNVNKSAFVLQFPVNVKEFTLYGANSNERTISKVYVNAEASKDIKIKDVGRELTGTYTNTKDEKCQTLTAVYDNNNVIPAGYYVLVTLSGSVNFYRVLYTEAECTDPVITMVNNTVANEGESATVSVDVTALGATYQWYTCDDELGTNPQIIDGATAASYTFTKGTGVEYFKVVVGCNCSAVTVSAVAKAEVWAPTTTLVDVTENTVWDWTIVTQDVNGDAIDASNGPKLNTTNGMIIGNYIIGNNFDKVEGNDGAFAIRNASNKYYQGASLHMHTTVSGYLKIHARNDGNTMTLSVQNAGRDMSLGSLGNWKDYTVYVQAGDVVIYNVPETAGKPMRIDQMTFTVDETPDYTRNVTSNFGTLCVEKNVVVGGALGATFYQIASRNEDYDYKIDFEEVLPNEELKAGEPYLFKSNTGKIELYFGETEAPEPVAVRGMIGNYDATTLEITEENKNTIYYFAQNKLWLCDNLVGGNLILNEHRAYINLTQVPTYAEYEASKQQQQNSAPRRRVSLEMNGEKIATGCENLNVSDKPVKMIINGQLFILRGEKMYDAKGQLVK